MDSVWSVASPLTAEEYVRVRRRAIFECCKWDPQVGDVPTLAEFPLVLDEDTWIDLKSAAEALYRETLAAEAELVLRPALHSRLGLPRPVRRALAQAARSGPSRGLARFMRFDFHLTTVGWRISEVNSDVPGGFIEAAGFSDLMAAHYPELTPAGNPATALADALARHLSAGATVALLHATAYTDDRQVMTYLAARLAARGMRPVLASPTDLYWTDGVARLARRPESAALDAMLRFFPAEWLPNLPRSCGWMRFFAGGRTPQSNPAVAILTQSKRFPLLWDQLRTELPTWRQLLPETRAPRWLERHRADGWVLKPALGRVGDSVGISGVSTPKELRRIARQSRWYPAYWIAQRRFESAPCAGPRGFMYPCLGIFVIEGRAAGAYGRIAPRPLIDEQAQDAAVLLRTTAPPADGRALAP